MDALTKARKALASRAEDKRLMLVPGLADDLLSIGEALAELERRVGVVAAVVLRKHYWPNVAIPEAQWRALVEMRGEPAAVGRAAGAAHVEDCLCPMCFPMLGGE